MSGRRICTTGFRAWVSGTGFLSFRPPAIAQTSVRSAHGDVVNPYASPICTEDSHGRPMSAALTPGVIPSGMALVLADHPGSFDSRYFGFVPLDSLQRVKPLLPLTPKEIDHAKQRIFTRCGLWPLRDNSQKTP